MVGIRRAKRELLQLIGNSQVVSESAWIPISTISTYFFDFDKLLLNQESIKIVVRLFADKINKMRKRERITKLGFIVREFGNIGTIPLAASLSSATGLKSCFLKAHGVNLTLKGEELDPHASFVIIEGVTTTGSALRDMAKVIWASGSSIAAVLTFFDREEGAKDSLRSIGVRLIPILTKSDLINANLIPPSQLTQKSVLPTKMIESLASSNELLIGRRLGIPDNVLEITQLARRDAEALNKYPNLENEFEIATFRAFRDIFRKASVIPLGMRKPGKEVPDGFIKWTSDLGEIRQLAYECKTTARSVYSFPQKDIDAVVRYVQLTESLFRKGLEARLFGVVIVSHDFFPKWRRVVDEIERKTLARVFLLKTNVLKSAVVRALDTYMEYPQTEVFVEIEDMFKEKGIIEASVVEGMLRNALDRAAL